MPDITFAPTLRDVQEILTTGFYVIPRFQRPYSWNPENLEDFWRDVVQDNSEGYFIGPMVAFRQSKGLFGLTDGQQRLTTITLMLCALRDEFQSIKASKFEDGLKKYIERADDDSVKHFVLRSDVAGDYLKSQIQYAAPRSESDAQNDDEKALKRAFSDIKIKLRDEIKELSFTHSSGAEHSPAALRLREIRDKILGLSIVWIQLDNEDDAYIVFETLNSRGKDLETIDLLKNLLFRHLAAENGDLDTPRSAWIEMRTVLRDGGGGVNANTYVLHFWLSRSDYVAERKLFRAIKGKVKKSQAGELLGDLRRDAELYARISNPTGWNVAPDEQPVRAGLLAINMFGVRQPRPLLLALLRAYRSKLVPLKKVRRVLRAVESYHFISTAIVGVSSTGGISMMYASHARELYLAKDSLAAHKTLDELVLKLHSRRALRDTFISEFGTSLRYSTKEPSAGRLVRYVLSSVHDYSSPGSAFDHAKCNIEHLSPQSAATPWMADIGNLLWIDSKLNDALADKPFTEKRIILEKHKSVYDFDDILATPSWGKKQVEARSRRLAELSYDSIWNVN